MAGVDYNTPKGEIATSRKPPQTTAASELMERIREGQWEALRDLYQRYSAGVYQLARRRLNDDRMAEDVVQDVFLRVWYHAGKWDASRGSVDTWILVIARHVTYDYLRNQVQQGHLRAIDEALVQLIDPQDSIGELIELETMNQMLETLSPEQRQVIRLIYADGLTAARAAEVLGIPLGTVKSRLRLALDHLRRHLEMEAHSDGAL